MRQKTIKQRLLAYYMILFFLSTTIAVYINIGTGKTLKIYSDFTNQYSGLNLFYKDVAVMDGYAQMYLYNSDEEYLELYQQALTRCYEHLSGLHRPRIPQYS